MADLDTLRPEVAQALGFMDRNQKYGDGSVCAGDIDIIRAELLRLTRERDHARQMHAERDEELQDALGRAENAEAELAALKARIAEAPVGVFGLCYNGHEPGFLGFPQAIDNLPRESMLGKRVRLLVVED